MIKYAFRELVTIQGARDADPQAIGEALEAIADMRGGELTPSDVVDAARDKAHVLHPNFEWDDRMAAEKFRLDQARGIIRSIVVEDNSLAEGVAPAYISVTADSGVSYRSLAAVRASPDLRASVLEQAERDLASWTQRYRSLQDVCAVVEKAKTMVRQKRKREEPRPQA